MSVEHYKSYKFRYVCDGESPGQIKVYVESQPSYAGRNTSSEIIHRWPGKNGSPPYICFKKQFKPKSIEEARSLSRRWADATDKYIRTGIPISDQ
jgi:hypothetical protein